MLNHHGEGKNGKCEKSGTYVKSLKPIDFS